MTDKQSAFLTLRLHDNDYLEATLECLPLDSDRDGLWVQTSLAKASFKSECTWFLASISQREVASIYRDLTYGKRFSEFAVCDTDCSFELTFKPDLTSETVPVALGVRCCLEKTGPAIVLDLQHATARLSEVLLFLQRLSQFVGD